MENETNVMVVEDNDAKVNKTENLTSENNVEEESEKCESNSDYCVVNRPNSVEQSVTENENEAKSPIDSENVERCLDVTNDYLPNEDHLDSIGTEEVHESESDNMTHNTLKSNTESKLEEDYLNGKLLVSTKTDEGSNPNSTDPIKVNTSISNESPGEEVNQKPFVASVETSATAESSKSSTISSPATVSADSGASTTISNASVYHVKWINGTQIDKVVNDSASNAKESNSSNQSDKIAIVTQNENGPCPLLSIVNVLLFRRKLTLPEGFEVISAEQLLEYIGEICFRL